ncbi:NUC153 protein [Rhizoctonia solani]|uniref:NUC153 protein n=1 Tax=Rhizoctonia solani TaxID=456999 RepID=A0A8H7M763_9AGAM|nr:NUC153 protein [Rhizoctonia solani]
MSSDIKVYTVNGAPSNSTTSLPDWLVRKRAAKGKSKREIREHVQGTIDLVQHFEFPEASNRIKTTRDGHHAMATGTYKPQIRVYDLDQLSMKFERHTDAENVDFLILSDDWTKSLHLQNDRTLELHTQGGFHYRTRIPKFGRTLAYHFPSCDALVAGAGSEVYRLNLAQGRFMAPFSLESDIEGVNAIDINPAHQLFAFGVDGRSVVDFWDPRAKARLSSLELPVGEDGVTALSSRGDGLSLAVGTAAGKTLLYDLRSARPFATKDQGYGLPVQSVSWIEGGSRMAGDGLVISADRKVVKIWDRNSPGTNFTSITPSTDINHLHHLPGTGMLMLANEGIQMTSYYIPQLGPAPRWCSFLDNITEEMEEQTVRNVYDDYKFVERAELDRLGLTHLIGTPTLKPYMHGFFLSLKLYDAARLIANPFAYEEHRERVVRDKLEKLSESRIRSKGGESVKVNKALAERAKRLERKKEKEGKEGVSLLSDPRFAEVFENPEFEVDTESREYGLLNPSTSSKSAPRDRTAVESEEEDTEKSSSDGLGSDSESDSDLGSEDGMEMDDDSDSSREGDLVAYDPRSRPLSKSQPHSVPQRKQTGPRLTTSRTRAAPSKPKQHSLGKDAHVNSLEDGGFEMSFVPSGKSDRPERKTNRPTGGKKVERFGAGMERGGWRDDDSANGLSRNTSGETPVSKTVCNCQMGVKQTTSALTMSSSLALGERLRNSGFYLLVPRGGYRWLVYARKMASPTASDDFPTRGETTTQFSVSHMLHLATSLVSLWLATLPPAAFAAGSGPVVHGADGLSYVGTRNTTSRQDYFLGIPFAQPPVGRLRFKPPVAWAPGNTTEVDATQFGATCQQPTGYVPINNALSEDCLTLNIWKPTDVTEKLPVMVYIYGGAFFLGDTLTYPGAFLVNRANEIGKPIIYVSINYRVGIYGSAYDAGGRNLGFKDQRLALEWVNENIGYFGGDSTKVTLFGTSAGGISAGVQTFYKKGEIGGLFHGIILESGSPGTVRALKPDHPIREAGFRFLANATGCLSGPSVCDLRTLQPDGPIPAAGFQLIANATGCLGDPSVFECIQKAPADVLSQANVDVLALEPTIFGPSYSPEDDFIAEPVRDILYSGKFAKVPFINGAQLDEGPILIDMLATNFSSEQDIVDWLTSGFGMSNLTAINELLKFYSTSPAAGSPYGTGDETFDKGPQFKRIASALGDYLFQAPRRDHLTYATKFGVKSWSYILKESSLGFPPKYGIAHGGDIPFVFQTLDINHPNAPQAAIELMKTIGSYWVNFAYSLDPNAGGDNLPLWPQYGEEKVALQLLGSNVTTIEDTDRTEATDFILKNDGSF